MIKRLTGILLFSCITACLSAQNFSFDIPRKKDAFATNLLSLLNDAQFRFAHVKGKLLSKTDSVHLGSQIYQNKVFLPGATAARYVQDSTFYLEYFFGEYPIIEEASEALNNLTTRVSKAMNNRVVVLSHDWGTGGEIIKENKISYAMHNGFFHYNIALQVTKILMRDNYRLAFQVYSGRPFYYNWIMKNEPFGGFNFVKSVKNTFQFFDNRSADCPAEIPTFTCRGKTTSSDSTLINYSKDGFFELMQARSEYEVVFSNLRAGLGNQYVFFTVPFRQPYFSRVAFVKFDDVDQSKRRTLILSLVQKNKEITDPSPYKREYKIELIFAY